MQGAVFACALHFFPLWQELLRCSIQTPPDDLWRGAENNGQFSRDRLWHEGIHRQADMPFEDHEIGLFTCPNHDQFGEPNSLAQQRSNA